MRLLKSVLLVGTLVIFCHLETDAAPKVVLRDAIYDAGEVRDTGTIVAEFSLRNEGTSPLTVSPRGTSCGCLSLDMTVIEVLPGRGIVLAVQFDTVGLQGERQFAAFYETNDSSSPALMLTVKATVRPLLRIRPRALRAVIEHGMAEATVLEAELWSDGVDTASFAVSPEPVNGSPIKCRTELVPADANGGRVKLRIVVEPPERLGRFRIPLGVSFQHKGRRYQRILPAYLTVSSHLLESNEAYLGIVIADQARAQRKSVAIACRPGVRATDVACTLATVMAEVDPEGRRITLTYVGQRDGSGARSPKGMVEGTVTIHFEGGRQLSLPVTYYVIASSGSNPVGSQERESSRSARSPLPGPAIDVQDRPNGAE